MRTSEGAPLPSTSLDPATWPDRPVLSPGVRITRRCDGRRQVGLAPGRRVLLPDTEQARALLAGLLTGRARAADLRDAALWSAPLVERGLVVDAEAAAAARRAAPTYAAAVAALARHGARAAARLHARRGLRVGVDTDDEAVRGEVVRLLGVAGLPVARRTRDVAVRLVVSPTGEPDRERTDPWMRAGSPHLLVTHCAGRLIVGPFVSPGLTACLRCRDADDSDRDPGIGLVREQHTPRGDDRPDPLLLTLALTLAVQDLVTYAEGDVPATWSACVDVDAGLALARRDLARHPRCGCSWGEGLATA